MENDVVMSETEIKPISITLDAALRERLQARRRKPQLLTQEAIQQYLEREEKREAFLQDARKAWEEYQATGLHVTLEEVDAWLAKLEAGEEADPPVCHV